MEMVRTGRVAMARGTAGKRAQGPAGTTSASEISGDVSGYSV
jgi:hypothetical protein